MLIRPPVAVADQGGLAAVAGAEQRPAAAHALAATLTGVAATAVMTTSPAPRAADGAHHSLALLGMPATTTSCPLAMALTTQPRWAWARSGSGWKAHVSKVFSAAGSTVAA